MIIFNLICFTRNLQWMMKHTTALAKAVHRGFAQSNRKVIKPSFGGRWYLRRAYLETVITQPIQSSSGVSNRDDRAIDNLSSHTCTDFQIENHHQCIGHGNMWPLNFFSKIFNKRYIVRILKQHQRLIQRVVVVKTKTATHCHRSN